MAFVTSVSATLKAYVVENGLVLEGPNKPAKRKKKLNNTTVDNSTVAKKMRVDDGRNYLGGVLLNNNYPPSADVMQPSNNMDMAVAAALGNYQAILKNSTSSALAAVAAAANPRVNNSSRTAKIRARADADQAAEDADSLESRSSNGGGISRRYSRRVTDDTSPSPQGLARSTSGANTSTNTATAKVDQSPMGRLLAVGSLALEHEVEKGEAAAAAVAAARNKAREEQEERERQTRLLVQQELERRVALAQQVREIERELVIRQLQNQASMRFSHHQVPSQQPVVHNGTDMSVMRMLENELARRRAAAGQNTR